MRSLAIIIHTGRTGLGIIRSLEGYGFDFIGIDTIRSSSYSSFFKFYKISKNYSEQELLHLLLEEIPSLEQFANKKRYLFTGADNYLLTLSKHSYELSRHYERNFEYDYSKLLKVLSKSQVYSFAEEASVDFPKTICSTDIGNNMKLNFPVVVKPVFKSRNGLDLVKEGLRISICKDVEALNEVTRRIRSLGSHYIVQEFIPGGDDKLYTFGCFVRDGIVIAGAVGKKIRQFPPGLGECSLGEIIENPEVSASSIRLLRSTNITGLVQVEWKEWGGKYYLIEINPRPWSWQELFSTNNWNLPFISTLSEYNFNIDNVEIGRRWMFIYADFYYNVLRNRNVGLITWIKSLRSISTFAYYRGNLFQMWLVLVRDLRRN